MLVVFVVEMEHLVVDVLTLQLITMMPMQHLTMDLVSGVVYARVSLMRL